MSHILIEVVAHCNCSDNAFSCCSGCGGACNCACGGDGSGVCEGGRVRGGGCCGGNDSTPIAGPCSARSCTIR